MIIINFTVGTILTIALFVLGIRMGLRNKLRPELARSLTYLFFGVVVFGLESQRVVDVLQTGMQRIVDLVAILLNRSGERTVTVPNVQQGGVPIQWFDLLFTVATVAAGYSIARFVKKRDTSKPGTPSRIVAMIIGVANVLITGLLIFTVATKFFGSQWHTLLSNRVDGSIGVPNVNSYLPSFASNNPFLGWAALALFVFFIVLIGIIISAVSSFIFGRGNGGGGGGGAKPGGGAAGGHGGGGH